MKNKILIVGGNFANTGAEALSYVTISELKSRFPHAEIVLLYANALRDENKDNYLFAVGEDNVHQRAWAAKKILFRTFVSVSEIHAKNVIKKLLKNVLKKDKVVVKLFHLQHLLQQSIAVVDISGYAVASSWPPEYFARYQYLVEACARQNIPMYCMPQSFGPFDFDEKTKQALQDFLPKITKIFVREQEGYALLKQNCAADNIILSPDLVLQNKTIDYSRVLKKQVNHKMPTFSKENNVAILPNMRLFDQTQNQDFHAINRSVIDELLSLGKTVYVVRHSVEDIVPAREIKKMYPDEPRVILLETQYNSYQYEELVQAFDFIIASRYHAIVHAYKHHVPCIAIGWAVKYIELLENMQQSQYMFDARSDLDAPSLLNAIHHLTNHLAEEKETIATCLAALQKDNCFDIMERDLNNKLNNA